VAERGIILQTI